MLALTLDYHLDEVEQAEVEIALDTTLEVARIPWLLPLRAGESTDDLVLAPERVRRQLQRAGIGDVQGRVLLVAPAELSWYLSLAEAIRLETGHYPLLIQPSDRRAEIGFPGPLRILDMEAYLLDEDASVLPPWLRDDD